MGAINIRQAVVDLSSDAFNAEKNFNVALAYDAIGQTASAVSFYLRAAEYGYKKDDLIVYASLIRTSHCFQRQGERDLTVGNLLNQAVTYIPTRPEAYFFIAQRLERKRDYSAAYLWACMGLTYAQEAILNPLPVDVDYLEYGLEFEKAVGAWWVGRKDESEVIFTYLLNTYKMKDDYISSSLANLKMIRDKDAS